ncbi:MAG TPA: PGDYG domain-containing protein [Acetobacteraceae bacterium]|nr:PGDYG domain-containing protein [Acetobacteraceae bacterium]
MSHVPDLAADPRALQVRKRPLPVQVTFASADGICATLEGPVRYRRGDAILTGTRGELWPVTRGSFFDSYEAMPPTSPGQDGTYRKRPAPVLALRLERALAVPVGWQDDLLQARRGDWLLHYADGSHGVVSDRIFRDTYEPAGPQVDWPPPC